MAEALPELGLVEHKGAGYYLVDTGEDECLSVRGKEGVAALLRDNVAVVDALLAKAVEVMDGRQRTLREV